MGGVNENGPRSIGARAKVGGGRFSRPASYGTLSAPAALTICATAVPGGYAVWACRAWTSVPAAPAVMPLVVDPGPPAGQSARREQ
jgi:hypothetical protein